MPGMKITLDAAMRARDVSRPRAEDARPVPADEPDQAGGQPQPAGTGGGSSGASSAGQRRAGSLPIPADAASGGEADRTDSAQNGGRARRRRR